MANPWRTYHVTDISTTVFSCWKGSGRRRTAGEGSPILVVFFDVISPFKDCFLRYTCLLVIADCKTVRMTIIVFLVDTSASMNQRTYIGTTILDTAKGAVETFMKVNLIISSVKLNVLLLTFVMRCCSNWKMLYFRLDLEIQTADGIVTCCWHSTNRRRTSEWVDFQLYSVDFVTDKCSIRYMGVSARFVCGLYRCLDDIVAITTRFRENESSLMLYAIFAFIMGWAGRRALTQYCITARSGGAAVW